MELEFEFKIRNVAKQSMRVGRKKYRDPRVSKFEQSIKLMVLGQLPRGFKKFTRASILSVEVEYYYRVSGIKRAEYRVTVPDIDSNINKALFDALNGIIWEDDRIICRLVATKYNYTEDLIRIKIKEMEQI